MTKYNYLKSIWTLLVINPDYCTKRTFFSKETEVYILNIIELNLKFWTNIIRSCTLDKHKLEQSVNCMKIITTEEQTYYVCVAEEGRNLN